MHIHIHVHHHNGGDEKILKEIKTLTSKIEFMGEKLDAIRAELSAINESKNNIAADLERLAGQISGGLTAEEADTVVADLKATADKLKAIADINQESTPPNEPGTETV